MSLVTRCPACGTAFKVVRDQLRISDGWVRCGRCSEVFDAMPGLVEAPAEAGHPPADDVGEAPPSLSTSTAAEREPGDAPPIAEAPALSLPAQPSWPDARLLDFPAAASADAVPPPDVAPLPTQADPSLPFDEGRAVHAAPPASWFSRPDLPTVVADEPWPEPPSPPALQAPLPAIDAVVSSPVDEAVDAQLQKALRRTRIQALRETRRRERAQAEAEAVALPPLVPPAEVSAPSTAEAVPETFRTDDLPVAALREASSDVASPAAAPSPTAVPASPFFEAPASAEGARPASGRRTVGWGVAIVLAALLLVFQVLRHEGDTLLAVQPAWQPVLAAVCALSGCELGPQRRIDAVRIEGSGFTPQRNAPGYRLDFTLRSAATQPLAMPSVELTLLDSSERPVVRRVLNPQDFGAPAVLAPHAEQAASLPLALRPPEGSTLPAVIGYRLVLFYP